MIFDIFDLHLWPTSLSQNLLTFISDTNSSKHNWCAFWGGYDIWTTSLTNITVYRAYIVLIYVAFVYFNREGGRGIMAAQLGLLL